MMAKRLPATEAFCPYRKAPSSVPWRTSLAIAISPMTLECPRCKAKPGKVCEILQGEIGLVHLQRIKAALTMDVAAKKANERSW